MAALIAYSYRLFNRSLPQTQDKLAGLVHGFLRTAEQRFGTSSQSWHAGKGGRKDWSGLLQFASEEIGRAHV
jgi:hypothetical protein